MADANSQSEEHRKRSFVWTDVVGTNFPEGVHHVCVAVQTKDLFLCSSDGEFASAMDVCVVCQVESSEARFGEICQEDIPPLAKVGLPHFVTALEIR